MREEIDAAVPRTNAACNVRTLPLTPAEGFVLSRIDGHATLRDLGASTGLGEKVREIVARLVQLGAVHRVAGLAISRPDSTPVVNGPTSAAPASVPRMAAAATATTPRASAPPASSMDAPPPPAPIPSRAAPEPIFDQALLDEPGDLDLDAKKRILRLSERLSTMTHYEVLEVPRTATKKEIKSAYYRLAPEFHPDRWFRRELGSFKARIEAIFVRITEAQDVLASKQGRIDYDASLPAEDEVPPPSTNAFEELTFGDPVPSAPAPSGSRDILVDGLAGMPDAGGIDLTPPPPPPRERTLADEQRRRAALAARLRGGPSAIAAVDATDVVRQPNIDAAADTLKRRYDEAREANDRGQVARFLEVAELAASRNDPVSAANAYRLAAKMAPEDTSLAEQVAVWSHKALVSMADAYLKQGETDERNGRLADAAQAYLRATVGMPRSAVVHDRAAALLLLSGGDGRKAVEMARRAVELAPSNLAYRVTLAEAYLGAKLFVTARSELEKVLALEPSHEKAKALLKQVPR